MDFHHISVMPAETVEGLLTRLDGTYVDCTLGGGGHARMIADRLSADGHLIGIDQDEAAIAAASERLSGCRCHVDIVRSNFSRLSAVLEELGVPMADGFLFDLGVSSYQIDTTERGFSYMKDAPLDMRMNQEAELSAYTVVNTYSVDDLSRIFKEYGEERWARRIAEFVGKVRQEKPIETTGELVDIIKRAVPSAVRNARSGHPAKRIFQAIRIEVNNELGILEDAFCAAVGHLRPGGRIAIITFHSLEDRIAKNVLRQLSRGCICPVHQPVCTCGHKPEVRLLVKGISASEEELGHNLRAKSARLRIAQKL